MESDNPLTVFTLEMAEQQIRLPEDQMNQYIKYRQEEERCIENINRATVQLETELRNRRSKYITRQEIAKLPQDVPVYSSVGKAFLLDSVPTTLEKLRSELGKCDEKVLLIKKTGIYILGQQDEVRNQIDELLAPYIKK